MPTYEVLVRRQRRSFLLRLPNDWATFAWGSLPLVIGLHTDGQTPKQLYDAIQIGDLMAGVLTPSGGMPDPQKFVALFPQALSLFKEAAGNWNTGFSATPMGLADVDDVGAIVACVEEANRIIALEWASLNPMAPPPAGPFFDGILVLGFGTGGTLAYRCAIELPIRATIWGPGALEPDCIAVAECSSGGFPYTTDSAWPFALPTLPGGAHVEWRPAPGATTHTNVLHMQSDADARSPLFGGVSDADRTRVDTLLGLMAAPGTAAFYPWSGRMGPVEETPAPAVFDPNMFLMTVGLGPWVSALPGGAIAPAVSSTSPGGVFDVWTWESSWVVVVGPPGGGTPLRWAVSFVLWSSDPLFKDFEGHYWPNDAADGFSGTREAWRFFQDHA
jgi:hypothetical protein